MQEDIRGEQLGKSFAPWPSRSVDHVERNAVSCEAMKIICDVWIRPTPVGAHSYDVRLMEPRTDLRVLQHSQVIDLAGQAPFGSDIHQYRVAVGDEAGKCS